MSTAPFTGVYPFAVSDAAAQHIASVGEATELPVRRRANVNQARAIEKLGRAVDHLIYSRMFLTDPVVIKAETDAIHILMVSRRRVFEECETVAQGSRQMKQWIMERVGRRSN
ncbi:MAG TPA: hypothetical protein VK578_22175 [Edaphobacter sp.]|nr:hypothetical protein [Edaphobacter sp.]